MFRTYGVWKISVSVVATLLLSIPGVDAGQTAPIRQLMREKLTHMQRLLEALTTSNFSLLEHESEALAKIPRQPGWMALNSPEYRKYSEAFLRAVADINTSAKARDLDESAKQFQSLTMSCYQCHRYMRNSRLAEKGGWSRQPPTSFKTPRA